MLSIQHSHDVAALASDRLTSILAFDPTTQIHSPTANSLSYIIMVATKLHKIYTHVK